MSNSLRAQTVRRLTGGALLALCVGLAIERAGAQQQASTGANVNVISGTGPDGDWTLQRQNEPTMGCSSRNPQHCLAGANDYRTVDIPFPAIGEKVTGDAWLGWYTTKDGGLTWRTRLLPGFPQDTSAAGLASPLRGYAAGADPVIRPGTNGLFYYGGLAFNREEGGGSAIFIARFIDNNNQEGTAGEPIDYLGASIVHRIGAAPTVAARSQGRGARPSSVATRRPAPSRPAPSSNTRAARVRAGVEQQGGISQLVDKPWIAVDIPRTGAQTCSIGGPGTGVPLQTFPGGRVYVVHTLFDGVDEQQGRIMFSRSLDCGVTWSPLRFLSRVPSADVNDDGVASAADLTRLQASWGRSCGNASFNPNADTNNDCTVNAIDLNFVSRGVGLPVPRQPRLSQGATLAIDPQSGALQVAWRQFNDGVLPDTIVTARSTNGGATFGAPTVVATLGSFDQGTTVTSFRTNAFPTMAFDAAGRLYLAWSARGYAPLRSDQVFGDARVVLSTSTNGTTWSLPAPVDNQQEPGHQIMPALAFAQGKLQLIYYDLREDVSQLFSQFVDELPILNGQHQPGLRHTVDVRAAQADPAASPVFTTFRLSQYRSGSVPGSQTIQQLEFSPPNLPLFRAGTSPFMGDYIDTAPAAPFVRNGTTWSFNTAPSSGSVFHAIWTDNRDVRPPANGDWSAYTAPDPPFGRPAMSGFDPTQAIPGCVPGQAGMRNQNIYTARITQGLVVGALTNSQPLGAIQRSFPVFAQNNATVTRSYRLVIANQPVGGQASFKQFEQLATLDVQVPPRSTVARTVFVRSSDPHAQVVVNVTQITAPSGTIVPGGQQGTIVLNPDPTNPDIENPDIENPDIENPDIENSQVYNPDIENARVKNPDIENPDIENPDIENPDIENVVVANPTILNPDIENPDIENPDIENPDIENPDIENTDLVNGALSDTTWTLTNKGNAAAAFSVKLLLNRQLPFGFKSQLIAHKIYKTPAVLGCSLLKQSQTVLIANVPNPRFASAAELANPDIENPDIENVTVALAPGETVRITLRVLDPVRNDNVTFQAAASVTPAAVAQAVSTVEAAAGVTQPAVAAVLTTSAPVPGGTSGSGYTTALQATLPGTWTVAGGTVPPGLTVDPNTGAITGTPTTPGTYTFSARFQSTIGITDYQTVTITVGAVGAAADVAVSAVAPTGPVSIGTNLPLTLNVSNIGPAAATNVRLTDTLPPGTAFVSATTTAGTCQHSNGTLTCNLGTLPSGGSATIVLTVSPTIGGSHTNRAVVAADQADPVATNNAAVSTATSATVAPCTTVCFSGPTSYIASDVGVSFGAEKGDFNEDGYVDLIYGPAGVNTVGILLGNGMGGFGAPTTMTIPGSPDGGAVADFNNDGHLDVVIMSNSVPQAWVFLGNGLGGFGAPAIITLPNTPENVVAADFNRDGNVDMALAGNSTGPLVIILHGNGNGTFQPPTTIGTTTGESVVLSEDFNNDGNPDLAVYTTNALMILLGNGASGFQPPTTIPVPDASGIVKVGDLTGDGFADLIVGTVSATASQLLLFAGNGAGGFAAPVPVGSPLIDDAPAVGDLDSDGDLDLVWARSGGGVGIQLNDGTGTFAAPFYLSSPQTSQPVIADFNGDGRPDLALPIGGPFLRQGQVLVFLNTCDQPPADLAVALQGPTDPVLEGNGFTYNIQVTNNGPNPATGVQLDFTFGVAAEFVAIGGSPGSCSVVRMGLTCQLGTLASGASAAFAVVVRPLSGGTLQSTAGVTGTTSDPNPDNNAAFAQTTVTPGASTLVVTNTNEGGPGSFRLALIRSNDGGPRDTITFNIPGAGPHTIRPTTFVPLPQINQSVVIDGTTQPGYTGTPLIEISGENAGVVPGLVVNGGSSVIRGLAINRFGLPQQPGIALGGTGGHTLEASFIGTNTDGTAALGNGYGIHVASPNNVIGGTAAGARNLISGNVTTAVAIFAGATGTLVSGNLIGTNLAGTAALSNGGDGIFVRSAGNTIGGTTAGAGNVISGNLNDGIDLGANNNLIVGNRIGTDGTGTVALPNTGSGVYVQTGNNNSIGSVTAGIGNTIAFNGFVGVRVDSGTGNAIVNNRIFSNGSLGIDLAPLGVTANDAGDADTGPNNLLNFPVLSSARTVGTDVRVQVELNPTPSGPFRVDFYVSPTCDASGAGEGATPIGVASFGISGNPTVNFEFSAPTTLVPAGSFLTATVTDSGNNTSEFSLCELVDATAGSANLAITKTDSPDPVTVGSPLTYLMLVSNSGPDAGSNVTVTDTLPAGVTFVSASASIGSCSGTTTVTCVLGTVANGANVSVSIVVTPTTPGLLSNTAAVSATGTDPDTANNSATATTTVVAAGPSTFVVTNTLNSGAGSLRQAILDTNATPGADTITFAIPGTGVHAIFSSAQPTITGPVTIDGTTQPGYAGTPLIELNGAEAGAGANGLVINGGDSLVRGLIINNFSGNGIVLQGGASNRVEGNWLGINATGTTAAGNANGVMVLSSGNTIGGTTAGTRNVLSGNSISGVQIGVPAARANIVIGNFIGTNPAGLVDLGNLEAGVIVVGEANVIGGTTPEARNVISGNDQTGVRLGGGATANLVQGNYIGTNVNGTGALANGVGVNVGVNVDSTASTNTVGGLTAGSANLIAFNTTIGVLVGQSSSDNAILGNSIHDNGTLGIDLIGNGVTANDPGDADEGANNLQNFPVLTGVAGGVQGTLNSTPSGTFRIEFFSSPACDASGFGEGRTFLGSVVVNTDATGNATIPFFAAAAGQFVSATATDSSNNTSEFSTCVQPLGQGAELAVTNSDSPDPVIVGTQLTYTVTVTNNGPSPATNVQISSVWDGPFNLNVATPSQGTCEVTPVLVCSFGALANGAIATVGIGVTPTAIGSLANTVTVQADQADPIPANNAVAVNTTVVGGPSSFLVTNTNDAGAGSLRQAILNANVSVGPDVISFAITGAGGHTVSPASALPEITDALIIDGASQPGFAGTPIIELNGNGLAGSGLTVSAANTTIRGLVINRFGGAGILIIGNDTTNTFVQGNYIGTDMTGTLARPNSVGIQVGNTITSPASSLIGGTTAAARNVISGNSGTGVLLITGNGNAVTGNYIGTSADGAADLGNAGTGVWIVSASNTTVGATATGAGNVISGNDQHGLLISGSTNAVFGNWIGTNAAGNAGVPNGIDGIRIEFASGNVIGGVVGFGNTVAFNTNSGLMIQAGNGNRISGNSIHSNLALGIDLSPTGITPNDPGDLDIGPNNLQNFPVLTSATGGVQGTLNSAPNATFRIEFFGNTACDASGNGEGATFLGATTVSTDGTGNATIPLFTASAGQFVTATATDAANNTSELSACAQTGVPAALTSVTPASAQQGTTLNVALTGQNTNFAAGTTTVSFGAGITVNSVTVTSTTAAAANITIPPTAFTGGRTVTVTTGTEIVTNSFTVTAGPAALTALVPDTAQQGQSNLNITVTGQGTHFVQNLTTAFFGNDITVNTVTVTSATSAIVNVTLHDFATPGLRTVTLTTGGENASLVNGFNVTAGTPRLSTVSPGSGQQGQTLNVAVVGQFTNFVNGTTTAGFGAGITVTGVTVTSATAATVNITISPLASVGSRTVTLSTGTEIASSLAAGSFFTVTAGTAAIANVVPSSGRQSESLSLTITGTNTHFASGSTIVSLGGDISLTSLVINSPTSVTVGIAISQFATLGARDVTVTTIGEVATIDDGFTVTAGLPAVTTVSPSTGRQAERLNLSVIAQFTHFVNGTTTASVGAGVTVHAVTVIDATHATVDVTVTPGAALGARTVVMSTGSEVAQLVGGFTVTPGQPTLFSISPVSAIQGTNLTVILNGAFTNFTPQVTTAFFGSGISVGTVTVNGPTLASVPIAIAAGATFGQRSVTVTTGSEVVTLLNGFTVVQGTPTVTQIDPNAGQQGLTRSVAITGVFTNWQNTVTSVSYGAGITVNSNVVSSATSLTTDITIDADATLGPRDVVITTGAEVLTVANGFTVTNVDVTAPALLRISPASGTTGVPLNTAVTAEFNEPLNRSTVTSATFQLYDTVTGQFIGATVSLDATGRVATLTPSQLLAVNRTHYAYLNSPITDVAGNHLGGQVHSFTTGFSTDTTGPTLRLANPQNGDGGVARNVRVVLQFDRPLNAATLGIGVRIQTGGATIPGTFVLEDGQRRLRFTPASQLAASTGYVVTLTSALRDVAGNALTNPGTISFTTGPDIDTTAPIVTASTPYYNEFDVGRRPVIRVAFSELINPITLTSSAFYLYNYYTNALIRSTISIAPDRLSATLVPDTPLEPYSYYYYYLSGYADIAGNAGFLGATYFRTSGIEDTNAPTLVSIAPASGATSVPVNARIRVLMSEPIDATSVPGSVQLTPAVAGATVLSADRLSLVFTPGANLAVSTGYTVQIGGLRDSGGNTMAPVVSSFTTSASPAADTTAPTVVSFSPTSGATNISVSSPIVMTVSEPIRSFAFVTSMRVFLNHPVVGAIQLAGTYTLNAAGTAVTFTPQVPYPGAASITVYSNYDSSTTDLAGNVLQHTTAAFTTAAIADTQPPTVVMVTPPDGAAGIGPAAVVTLTFSEPLHPSTLTNNSFALFSGATEISPSITRSADNTTVFLTATLPFNSLITVVATGDVTDPSGNPLADFSSTFSTGSSVETNRPQILTQRPTGPGIPAGADVTLFVSKPLNESTVPGALYVSQNGVLVEGTVTVSGGGTAVHFNPAANFAPGAAIQVFMTGDAEDLFGNALFDYSGSFTVALDATVQPPTIVRTSPAFFTIGHPTNAIIEVEFSEPLLPSTVNETNFYVRNAANLPVAGALSLRNGDRTIRFTPTAPFAASNYNYVYATNGLRDLQNTVFAGTNFYFYTGPASDAIPPTLSSLAPTNGATGIGVNATVRLHFSEAINPLTATSGSLSLFSSAGPIPASVTYNSTNTVVTIVPQVPLPASTTVTLSIDGVTDEAGNLLAAQTSQFTTGASADTVRPSVIATNVTVYGVNNVPINSTFQMTFDEPMDAATVLSQAGTLLYDYGLGNYLAGTASMSPDGLTLTFVPASPLAVNRQHGLFMSAGFDLSGNQQNSFGLLFTTTFAGDTTPPVVLGVNPVDGLTGVPRNALVAIRFSESISELSIGNVRLLTNGGTPVAVTRILSDTNRLLTLRPNGLLASNRVYTVSVTGVRDTSNNLIAAAFTSTFTTSSRTDLIGPTVTATSPLYNDTGVGLNMVARVTFSEPIDPLSISSGTFRMAHAFGGDYLEAVVALAADRRSATLTPVMPLLPYASYYFTLSGITDVAGNAGAGATIYFYTGATLDASAPTVVALSPPNGSTALPVNTRITVVMSEAIDPTSVSNASIQLTPAVPGIVTLAADRVTLTFVPSANLATSTGYLILISGLRDSAANTMAASTSGFTTGAVATPDTTAPTIVSRSPADGAAGVPVTSSLSFTTSERITAEEVGPDSVRVFAVLSGVGTFQLAGTYAVDASGTVVTFTITGAFPANATIQWYTNYSQTIRNMAGLPLPNQLSQFTTANTPDTSGPSVQTVTPSNGSADIGPYSTVTLTFSEAVNPNTVNATTVALFSGPARLSPSLTRSIDNRMVFLSTLLPADSTITVVATSGVTDLSGNALTPFSSIFTTAPAFDPTRPSVVTQRPVGSGVSPTTPITLFLNQPVNPSTVPGALFVSQNGVLVTGTVTVDGANQAIVFLPTTPFAASASVEITLTTAARDLDGNQVNAYQNSFTIAGDPATAAPTLRRTNPVIYSTGNPTTTIIDLEFSEPLNPATVTPANVFVRDSANLAVPGTLSLRPGNRVVRFTPDSPFPPTNPPNNYNYVYFTGGLLDLQGAAVAGSNFYFYTSGTADTTSPSVNAIVPSAGTTGVGVNGSIRVTFSEAVNAVSITPDTVTISAGGTPLGTTMTIGTGNTSLTVVPQRPLPPGTLITVTVNGVEDPSGHAVPVTTSSFTTGNAPDITPPVALAANILYGDTNVPVNTIFEWTYSEPIDATTVVGQQNVLYDYVAGTYIPGATLSVSADGRNVTLVPPANLLAGRQHFVGLGSVADLAGNVGGGISLVFTTSSATDMTPPQVLGATPASGTIGVPLNARVRLAFDEAISEASLGTINVLVSGLPLPVTARTMSDGNRVVTLTLGGLMAPNTVHTLSVDGVRDRAGNLMPTQVVSTFTTGTGVDLVQPANTVVTSPVNGATNVAVGTAPTVTYSEAVDPTTVFYSGTSGVVLQVAATGQIVPVVYSFSADRRTVTLSPVSALAAGTQYRLQLSTAVTDMAGNPFPAFLQVLFTTQP